MSIIVCQDWTDTDDYRTAWAPTSDPRVLAVIQRDDTATFQECLDGDAILPVYIVDRDRADHTGGYQDDDIAQRVVDARDRFRYAAGYRYDGLTAHHIAKADAMLARWAWVFHGTTVNRGNYGYQGDYDVLILNTPAFREHIEVAEQTREQAQEWVDSMVSEVRDIADGDVFGIGWAIFPDRVLADEPVDFDDFEVDIQVWGYVGEAYAKQAVGSDTDAPDLPALLELSA